MIKNKLNLILIIIILGLVALNLNTCSSTPEERVVIREVIKTITLPAKEGKFDTIVKLVPTYVKDTVHKRNRFNTELLAKYDKLRDSLKRAAYKEAVAKNTYKEKFENDTISIDIYAETTGTLDKLTTSYKIKESDFSYTEKEATIYKVPKFSIYAGVGVLGSFDKVNSTALSLNLGIINKKGLHIEGSYNTNKQFGLTIKNNIFTKY